jgi:hypothetical protein
VLLECCTSCTQAGFERGLTEFDFMVGDTAHNRGLSTMTREPIWPRWVDPRRVGA